MFVACLWWDLPYGLNLFEYDVQMTQQKLQTVIKQFDAINIGTNHVVVYMHKPADTSMVLDTLKERRYQQTEHLFWHKPGQTMVGPVKQYTPSVEMLTIGFYPDRNAVPWNVDSDPAKRHNHFVCPSVKTLSKDHSGVVINQTEKPPEVSSWVFNHHCPAGSTAFIVGAGSGAEIIGAARANVNSVAVEVEERQYEALKIHLNKIVTQQMKEIEDSTNKKKRKKPETTEPADSDALELDENFGFQSPSKNRNAIHAVECTACGNEIDPNVSDIYKCHECPTNPKFHPNCLVEVLDDDGEFKHYICDCCAEKQKS